MGIWKTSKNTYAYSLTVYEDGTAWFAYGVSATMGVDVSYSIDSDSNLTLTYKDTTKTLRFDESAKTTNKDTCWYLEGDKMYINDMIFTKDNW